MGKYNPREAWYLTIEGHNAIDFTVNELQRLDSIPRDQMSRKDLENNTKHRISYMFLVGMEDLDNPEYPARQSAGWIYFKLLKDALDEGGRSFKDKVEPVVAAVFDALVDEGLISKEKLQELPSAFKDFRMYE